MKHLILALLCTLTTLTAFAGTEVPVRDGWTDLIDNGRWKYQNGTFKVEQTRNGKVILTITTAFYFTDGTIKLYSSGIFAHECKTGYGQLIHWHLTSGEAVVTSEWATGAGNGNSNLAEGLCTTYFKPANTNPQPQPRRDPRSASWS